MSALISSIYRAYCYARLLEMRRNRRRLGAANARPAGWSQRALGNLSQEPATTRCTALVPMPSSPAIFKMP
jgi:hypothetical protein